MSERARVYLAAHKAGLDSAADFKLSLDLKWGYKPTREAIEEPFTERIAILYQAMEDELKEFQKKAGGA